MHTNVRRVVVASAAALALTTVVAVPAGAGQTIKTKGDGTRVNLSWTEYDPDNLIGAPGNVHVGYLYAENGAYGTWFSGFVTDFECAEGQTPFGGHHGVVDEGADVAEEAAGDAIEQLIDGGATVIDSELVTETISEELTDELTEEILDESFGCTYMGERYLEGDSNIVMAVDARTKTATISGNLVVTSGGHGEHGAVLGRPAVDITVTGGDWMQYEYSYSVKGEDYRYSNSEKGTDWNGGTVTGAIGAMGFADDADDESYGSFTAYSFRTVERLR